MTGPDTLSPEARAFRVKLLAQIDAQPDADALREELAHQGWRERRWRWLMGLDGERIGGALVVLDDLRRARVRRREEQARAEAAEERRLRLEREARRRARDAEARANQRELL